MGGKVTLIQRSFHGADKIVRPFGSLMRCRQRVLPDHKADIAFLMAFDLRKNGELNYPTASIVINAFELYEKGLIRKIFSCGGSSQSGVTEADAMALKLRKLGVSSDNIVTIQEPAGQVRNFQAFMGLVGEELSGFNVKTSYLIAHPLQLGRSYLVFKKRFPDVTFYPLEATRVYDWGSGQLRVRSEALFIPWNIAALVEHKIHKKI